MVVALFLLQAPIGILANIVANYVQQVLDEHSTFGRLTTRGKLFLFLAVFVLLQVPAVVLSLSVGNSSVDSGHSVPLLLWVPAIAFALAVAYLDGYYLDKEVLGRQPSGHLSHLIIGIVFSLALAPVTVSIFVLVLGQDDPCRVLVYHSLVPTFVLTTPAFAVSISRHAQRMAVELSPRAVDRQIAGYREDVEALGPQDPGTSASVRPGRTGGSGFLSGVSE